MGSDNPPKQSGQCLKNAGRNFSTLLKIALTSCERSEILSGFNI
jgi:hypothetical protein